MNNSNNTLGKQLSNVGSKTANTTKKTFQSGWNTTKNAARKSYRTVSEASWPAKVAMGVFMILFIILIIYLIVWALNKTKESAQQQPYIITSPVNAYSSSVAQKSQTVNNPTEGLTFSYSFWIFIADWNYRFGKWKNIFIKGSPTSDRRAPGLWLYPKTNSLHARINTYADANEGCDVRNIPLQKWVHIVYVLNNRTVDIYVDGKLERSCVLRGVPILNNDNVYVAQDGGFYGQIAKMQYFTKSLTPTEVSGIYAKGPMMTTSLFSSSSSNNSTTSE